MRTTVKTWLKSQEKAKSDGQDKADGREDSAGLPQTDKPSVNGDSQADVVVNTEAATEDPPPPGNAVETPAADLHPSIEVNFCHPRGFPSTYLTFSGT